jgi:ABC-type branched-subunit amino acid transport system ATPase component/branched-subunit amino acid ABC-type transport system permease component
VNEYLPFIVSGIATGSIYGLASMGLVLTYKTSGIFNFGQGAIATAAAYVFYYLHVDHGWGWIPAAVVAVLVLGPLLGLGMEPIARRLSQQRPAAKIVGTIGLILLVQGLGTVKYGADTIRVPQFLPRPFEYFRFGGVNISYPQLWVTLIGVVAAVGLFALFRFARIGLAMRAVVDDPDLVAMQATSPERIRRVSWIIGCTFAALSGVLVLPFIGLNAISLTFLVVQAFGAAALGMFSSIPLTFAGGLVIGVLANLAQKFSVGHDSIAGLPDSVPFIVLFLVLLILPRRRLVPPAAFEQRPQLQYRAPGLVRAGTGVLVLVPLLLVPQIVGGDKLGYFTIGLTQVLIILSLGLLVRTSGQVSLCHAAFAAIGATAFSQLAVDHGLPWFVALVLGALVAVPVGALIAIPAIRLSGLFLALATFGFGVLVERLFYSRGFMFTVLQNGRPIPRPSFGRSDHAYYYVVLGFVVVVSLLIVAIIRSRLGRVLRGLSESPVAVATMGLSTNTTRVIVFCISAFLAGVGGILYGGAVHFASTGDSHYSSFQSLFLLAVLAVAPFAEPWYAVLMGVASVIPAYWTSGDSTYWLNAIFGFFAIQVSLQGRQPQMPARLREVLERFRRPARSVPAGPPEPGAAPARPARLDADPAGLEVDRLRVRFGGLVAVDDLSFAAPVGRITGLIGPNGAGKTTTFDACSGLNRRVSGTIKLHGRDVTRARPATRGRLGLGRTFQRMQLGDSLTVAENVALGREAGLAGRNPLRQLFARPEERRETLRAATQALELCGIADLADLQAGALSTGQRRLTELARCLAGSFDVLILDEPSSGLDREETAAFAAILQRIVAERGCGILLVEHDVSLVMGVCSYIYVLDFGKLIFDGTPADVAASPTVQAAYLGSSAIPEPAGAASADVPAQEVTL